VSRRILIVEDNVGDKDLAVREIRRQLPDAQCDHVSSKDALEQHLTAGHFDAVVTDYRLPWGDGLHIVQRARERYPNKAIIMFTGTGNEDVAVDTMKAGANDYVPKGQGKLGNYTRLAMAVRRALEQADARERLGVTEAELRRTVGSLADKNAELESFVNSVIGRELKMAELVRENQRLKDENQRLKAKLPA
jgi:DNA-binding NtrC family response regulator